MSGIGDDQGPPDPPVPPAPNWADEKGREHQSLFKSAWTKACVMANGKPGVAILAEGDIYVYVVSPRNAMALALGLIEAAHNSVTNTMLFNSLVESGVPEADAGRMVTAYTLERHRQIREG